MRYTKGINRKRHVFAGLDAVKSHVPPITHIDPSEILEAFKHDKKNIGRSLQWVLLQAIGKPVIVPGSEVPASLIRSTVKKFIRS